jgi:hypothetical protein
VDTGGICDHTVEVEQDSVELVAVYRVFHGARPLTQFCFGCCTTGNCEPRRWVN